MNDSREPQEAREQRRMGGVMQALAWAVFLALGVWYFNDLLGRQHNPNHTPESRLGEGGQVEVLLQRNKFGHYVMAGTINGRPVTFLLDTGATGVAIPASVAEQLQLDRGRPVRTQTANGVATSYAVSLDRVSVGDIQLRDVAATIAPGMAIDEVLLGMSFLKHIEFTQRGNTLILRQ